MSGAHIAVHAAIEKIKREEEKMTKYTSDELDGDWEFKILRSNTGAFDKYEKVEQVKAEEAMAGWIMVEKFDGNRIRFKRPRSAQRNDLNLPPGVDPYRTTIGISEIGLAGLIMSILGLVGGLIYLLVWLLG